VDPIPVSILGDYVKGARSTTLEIGKKARDFTIALKEQLNSVQEGIVVTGCCVIGS
jgi:hypothetical protein